MTCQHLRSMLLYFCSTMLEVFGMLLDCCRIKVIKLLFVGAFVASKNLELKIVIETFRKPFERKKGQNHWMYFVNTNHIYNNDKSCFIFNFAGWMKNNRNRPLGLVKKEVQITTFIPWLNPLVIA